MVDVPRWLARVWLIAGALGVALGIAAAVVAVTLVGSTGQAVDESLAVTLEALEAVDEVALAVEDTIDELAGGLRTGQQATADGAVTLTQISASVNDVAGLLADDLPGSLESIREALPPVVAAAEAVDSTLRALTLVGVDYDPEVPFDTAVEDLDRRLAELPDQLRGQATVVAAAADGLGELGGDTLTLSEDLGRLRASLLRTGDSLAESRRTTAEATELVEGLRDELSTQVVTTQVVLVGLGLAVAASQTLPLTAGWWLLRRDDGSSSRGSAHESP